MKGGLASCLHGRATSAAGLLLCLFLCSCLGYDPSTPPAASLLFTLDLPASASATVNIYDADDQVVGTTRVRGGVEAELGLTPNTDFGALRLVARAGERVLKAVTSSARVGSRVSLGKVNADATAAAQLIQEKVAGQGGSFSSVPSTVVGDLLKQVKKGGTEIAAFTKLVRKAVTSARTVAKSDASPAFAGLDALLSAAFAKAHTKELGATFAADYRNALTAAVSRLTIKLVCDAALIKVMFTVDLSGEAQDGNGAPQLIRQPTKGDRVYLAITVDESSPVADSAGLLRTQMTPNDASAAMLDDGTGGDESAGDGVYTRVMVLPRGMRVKYKYTNGSAGEGWTRTEEWPGNARILEIKDALSRHTDGTADCLVVRRDAFGDEASNKNYVNTNTKIKTGGGTLAFDKDLGGEVAALVAEGRYVGGLELDDIRTEPPLSPAGLPEAAENGICSKCPAPLTMDTDDRVPPRLVSAEFTSTSRIKVSFSEAMEYVSASSVKNYLVLDGASRALPVTAASSSGATVSLEVVGPDFGQSHTLYVKNLKDASANGNFLPGGVQKATVLRDRTSPQVVSVKALPLLDFNPGATGSDPKKGQVIKVTFDEELDSLSAENVANYTVQAVSGGELKVHAAYLKSKLQVWLVTDMQERRRPYDLVIYGVRDLAKNLLRSTGATDPVRFYGFALYEVTFGAVPGFAFLDTSGSKRGLPEGEKLYLTGTVLAVARDLKGNSISVSGRTDLTGIPEFEMKESKQLYKGQPIYTIKLLAPPGSYAWKVAHGTSGEYTIPPTTLVKVHKSLCTTNDATGVNIDPVTLSALPLPDSDGKPISFLDYAKAKLSTTGGDAPGPFSVSSGATLPAPTVMFKRENPDEVCTVTSSDRTCPAIVIGTWRDIDAFKTGEKTDDYDDGQLEVDPLRVETDIYQPRLRDLDVRDSESLLLSFDERLVVSTTELKVTAKEAKTGTPLQVTVHTLGSIGGALLPHQVLLRTSTMQTSASYTLSYDALADVWGNKQKTPLTQSFTAPQSYQPFTPLADSSPPKVLGITPKSPTSLVVQFDEKILSADATNTGNFSIQAATGTAPTISAASLQGGGTAVHLTTGLQTQQASYTLVVSNIRDLAQPPNTLTEQKIKFKGFGDSTPPKVVYAAALSKTEVAVAFDEALSPLSAAAATSYTLSGGLKVLSVSFSGDSTLKASAFAPSSTTYADDTVVLTTSAMAAGQTYTVTPAGVTDLSGNACKTSTTFKGVAATPTVDVVFTYKISDSETVAGSVPGKAINPSALAAEREGVFILGCTVSSDGKTKGDVLTDPVTKQLGGFPAAGQPLDGIEPQLKDDGMGDDKKAGDNIYTLRIKAVPLGTRLQWKAFASYQDGKSGFADKIPGPSVYSDGQEYPGNENGVRILGDRDGDGLVWVQNLYGDEITYKKITDTPPFVWAASDVTWTP